MVKRLAIPMGTPGVREYRLERPARKMGGFQVVGLDEVYEQDRVLTESSEAMFAAGDLVSEERLKILADWLQSNGIKREVFFTNHYGPDSQVVQDVMRDNKVPVAVDVDDWFEDVPLGNHAFQHWWGMKRRWYKECLEEADRVVTSTPKLADKYGGVVAPNFVDPAEWDFDSRSRKDPDECVILCAGGLGRSGDFLKQEPEFKKALAEPNVKMVFMGPFPNWAMDYEPGKVVWCRWVPYEQFNQVARWIDPDIFVSPLERNVFNEAKSNLKWLESGMLDAVFVGEDFGEYRRTVQNGVDGVLCDSREDWADSLIELARDKDLRHKLSQANRESVLKNWTWDSVGDAWRKAVLGVENGTGTQRLTGDSEQQLAANG